MESLVVVQNNRPDPAALAKRGGKGRGLIGALTNLVDRLTARLLGRSSNTAEAEAKATSPDSARNVVPGRAREPRVV